MVSSRILLCAEFLKNRDEKLISFKASPALPSLASHRYYGAAHDSSFNVLQSTALAGEGPTLEFSPQHLHSAPYRISIHRSSLSQAGWFYG